MKRLALLLALLLPMSVWAVPVLFPTDGDIDVFDITDLMANPNPDPLFAAIAAGDDPNTGTRIPLNFNVFTNEVFDITGDEISYTEVAPELGGGFAFQTAAGTFVAPSAELEIIYFDAVSLWHSATTWSQIGPDAIQLLFDPLADGLQAGLIVSDSGTFDVPVSAVPIPPAIWLFGAGLLGMVGIARRKT